MNPVKAKFRGLCPACLATTDLTVWDGKIPPPPHVTLKCVNCGFPMTLTRQREGRPKTPEYVW